MKKVSNTASGRDKAVVEYYPLPRCVNASFASTQSEHYKINLQRDAFKVGWDARDQYLMKLHGEGAMAEVIQLQAENKRLRELLSDAMGYLMSNNPEDEPEYAVFEERAQLALKGSDQ